RVGLYRLRHPDRGAHPNPRAPASHMESTIGVLPSTSPTPTHPTVGVTFVTAVRHTMSAGQASRSGPACHKLTTTLRHQAQALAKYPLAHRRSFCMQTRTDMPSSNPFRGQRAVRGPWRAYIDGLAELRPALHRYCVRLTGNVWDGEDLVQDTLLRVFALL